MNRQKALKIFLHLVKTKQGFCFDTEGKLWTLDEIMTILKGRKVEFEEANRLTNAI